MEDLFKKISPINLAMIVLSLICAISFAVDGEWIASIWAFNTLCWVGIASFNEVENKDLKKENDELYSKLMEK
jgi:hypothetical protein